MKGEYIEHSNDHNNHPIFSKYQPHNFSDSTAIVTTDPTPKKPRTTTDYGSTVEVTRRPRGRPPGSKNKPKEPLYINREPDPPMQPCILEVPSGVDIIESLTRFTRRREMGICVLTASGSVANVTLKQPSAATTTTVTFHGRFEILSLSAVILNETIPFNSSNNNKIMFSISLAGPQGQIVGGKVVEPLIAAGLVYVIAASFNSPSYHRLPVQEVDNISGCDADQPGSPISGGGGGGTMGGAYNCHVGSGSGDVIWAPTARPPLPPPPY